MTATPNDSATTEPPGRATRRARAPAPRNVSTPSVPLAELLHALMLPDFERADRIGEFWGYQRAAPSPSY
jgi:hypothetical protein